LRFQTYRNVVWLICVALIAVPASCSSSKPTVSEAVRNEALLLLSETRFQPPRGWRWGAFRNADGARLRYGWAEPPDQRKGVVVFLPGFQATAEAVFETSRNLLDAGYAVWVLDRRGQGGSDRWLDNRQKSYSIGIEHDAHDVELFAHDIVHGRAGEPRFLAGESLGGHIGFRVLHDQPDLFQAAAFSSPSIAFHTGAFPEWLVHMVTRTSVALGFGKAYAVGEHDWIFDPDAGNAKDPAKNDRDRALMSQAWFLKDPALTSGGATNAFVTALSRSSALERSAGWLEAIKTPVLIGEVEDDQIADAAVMVQACARLAGCRLMPFNATRHALFSDSDSARSVWIAALIAYFDSRQAPSSH
jgi:lysophospholipase